MKNTLLLKCTTLCTTPSNKKNTTRFNGLLTLFLVVMGMNGVVGQVAQFNFPSTNSLVVSTKDANVTVSNLSLSAGTIETNITTGSYFPNEPYIEESGGWTATSQDLAKSFTFTITASSGYIFSITNVSFRGYATSSGPTAFGFTIGSTDIYSVNAPDGSVIAVNQSVSNQTGLTTATIKIKGWLNGSRTSTGAGVFRLDDLIINGSVSSAGGPNMTQTGVLNTFISSAVSSPSAEQTFTVAGTTLTDNIVITPPTGYQVSTTSGSGFESSVILTQSGGTVSATTVYARFNPTALSDQVGGNIAISTTGATTQNVAVSGEVTNLSAGAIAFIAFQGATPDLYRIVALNDIPNNTRIWFTDKSWDGNGGTLAFTTGEGNNVWTNTTGSAIAAGTVIQFDAAGAATLGTGGLSSGLGSAGEQLFAYQGTLTSPTFLAGFTSGTVISTGVPASTETWLPLGLTSGTNFVALGGNYGSSYITAATHNRSLADMRSHIQNFANLTTTDNLTTSNLSWPTYTFNIIADEPTTQPSFSAATLVGNNQMDLNFTGGNGTSYMVVMREASAVTASPTDATNYSLVSGSVNFASATELSAGQKIVYNGTTSTGTVTITNLSAGTTYHYAIYAYNGTTTKANFNLTAPGSGNQATTGVANSNVSDIIIHASFTEPSNIAYASTQENSNLTVGNSEEVAQFSLRDGGASADGDANSTTLNAITFTIANHTNLRRLALYDGSTELSEVAISAGTATFSGLTIAAGDNSTKDFSLRASFAGTVTDNSQFSFTVSSVTADIAGSTFAAADAGAAASSTTGDRNKIEVTADRLTFVQQPSNVSVNTAMSPAPTVSANDALANRDLDYVTDMTATTTGTFGSSTNSVTPVAGLGTFSNLQFSAATTGRTIEVTSGSLTASGNSSTFDITASIGAGDIAFIKYQSDAPDEFSIITFVDIPASQTFYFTDNQWTTESGPLAINEQTMTWTTPGTVIPAGTVITFSNPSGSTTTVTPSGNGTGTNALNGISASGDQIFMYKGSSGSPSQFICGLNFGNSGAWQTSAGIDSSISFLPADLTNNVNAISFASDLDNGYYGNTMAGSISTLKSLINNGANWTRSNSLQTPPTWSFTVNAITTTLTANATVQNLALASDETFVVGVNTLTINGSVTGSGTLAGSATSNLVITGASGTIAFDQTTPGTTNVLKNLTISGTGTTTLGNALNITAGVSSGNVTVGSGASLATGGFLTLKSDALGTASVGNSAGSVTGDVTVERYIPAKRAWRALTAPVIGSTNNSIFYNWQNNGVPSTGTGVELWSSTGGNGMGTGASNSILTYNNTGTTGAWNPVTNTNTKNLFESNINNAFMVFVTGPYATSSTNISAGSAITTLKATGQLITGTQTYENLPSGVHTLIGNPYACPISPLLLLNGNTSFGANLWVWDANTTVNNGVGAYNTYDKTANKYTNITNSAQLATTPDIQSGQAFFVKASTGTATLSISESYKSTGTSTYSFLRTSSPPELLRVGLYKQVNNEWSGRDGAMTVILADADANQASNKMANGSENVAFTKNGASFASNHHLPLVASDVLNVKVWNTTAGANYKLKINTEEFSATNLSATLEDLYTNARTPLTLDGTAVEYPFTVTTEALSTGDRFRIVFQPSLLGNNIPKSNGFSIVPNPVTGDSFQVNLGSLATGTYSYSICNTIGQEVEKGSINNATQNTNYEVKMNNSATGIYIMKIKGNDNSVFTAKIIKK